jgi:hypothetical protein
VSWAAVLGAAEQLRAGSFDGLGSALPGSQLNELFRGFV